MKCACCGQESDILICLDPFTLPERPRLSDQPATYCCEYCGSIIIRELMQNRTESLVKAGSVWQKNGRDKMSLKDGLQVARRFTP